MLMMIVKQIFDGFRNQLWWCCFKSHVWKVIRNLTEAMVSSVELYLNHETLGQNFAIDVGELGHSALCSLSIRWLGRSIRLSSIIVHLEIGTGLPGLPEDQQIRSYLDAFCVWQRKKRTVSRLLFVTLLDVSDLFANCMSNYIGRSPSFLKQWWFKGERLGPCPSLDRGRPLRQVWYWETSSFQSLILIVVRLVTAAAAEWPICQACVAHRSLSFQFLN